MSKKLSKHWIVLLVLSFIAMSSLGIVINVGGVFLTPISEDLGILQGTISVHASLTQFTSAIVGIFVPRLIDRYPFRRIILVGLGLISISSILLGLSSQVWQFNLLGIFRGVGVGLTALVPLSMTINQWFDKHYGLANSIVMISPGLIGAIVSPIISSMVETYSWRIAYMSVGLFILILAIFPFLYPFTFDPRDEGLQAYGLEEESHLEANEQVNEKIKPLPQKDVYLTPLCLFLLMSLLISGITSFNQHLPSLATYLGYSSVVSGSLLSAAMFGNIFFKLIIGILIDKTNALVGSLTILFITILSIFMFVASSSELTLILASFTIGSIYSVSTVGITTMTSHLFGPQNFSKVYPIVSFFKSLGVASFISVYGYVYDYTGSYYPNLWLMIATITIGLIALYFAYRSNRL